MSRELNETHGYLISLLDFLWSRDPAFGSVPSVNLPDTIVFSFNQPTSWYFSENGILKKKSKEKLKCSIISERFLRRVPESGIVAYFVKKTKVNDRYKYVFDYMDEARFRDFIDDEHVKIREGILQRFLDPGSVNNCKPIVTSDIIRGTWSPNVCVFEKIVNNFKLRNKRQDLYQRVVTLELENCNSRTRFPFVSFSSAAWVYPAT